MPTNVINILEWKVIYMREFFEKAFEIIKFIFDLIRIPFYFAVKLMVAGVVVFGAFSVT